MSIGTAVRYLQKGAWEKAHPIVQKDESLLGCWAHGVVHLLEGDLSNARYWYGRAQRAFPGNVDAQAEIAALSDAVKESER
jgi:hypothetical protein